MCMWLEVSQVLLRTQTWGAVVGGEEQGWRDEQEQSEGHMVEVSQLDLSQDLCWSPGLGTPVLGHPEDSFFDSTVRFRWPPCPSYQDAWLFSELWLPLPLRINAEPGSVPCLGYISQLRGTNSCILVHARDQK